MSEIERSSAEWKNADVEHYLHPFTNFHAMVVERAPRVLVRGEGCHLWDIDGNKYLDGFAGLACVTLGYGRKELAEAAAQQIGVLSFAASFFGASNKPAIALAETLVALTPAGLNHVFYGSTGSDANDSALRLVRRYWQVKGQPQRQIVISREHAYHGSTIAGGALSGIPHMHEQGATLPDIVHIQPPYQYALGRDLSEEAFGLKSAGWLEEAIVRAGPERVAAFWMEPIQGAGGFKMPPRNYLLEVERICRKYDVLLVLDEVITGFGRTGEWFASTTLGPVTPDLLCLAKGITSGYFPVSAVMVHDKIADALIADDHEFFHGFTYSGHPVGCALALENIRIIREERVIEKVRNETGPHFAAALARIGAASKVVGEVRAIGLMGAIELQMPDGSAIADADHTCEMLREFGYGEGIIIRTVGSTCMIAPPLIISTGEIHTLVAGIGRALGKFEALLATLDLEVA